MRGSPREELQRRAPRRGRVMLPPRGRGELVEELVDGRAHECVLGVVGPGCLPRRAAAGALWKFAEVMD